ncbi:MAG: AlpA family phage regulatory protein [Methylomonas sp.]|nr:AlpA family phage regulatory protein [Methylomonas sp.]
MATSSTDQLPPTGYLRLPQIIGNAKAEPPTPALIPVSKSTWWQGVKDGRFPKSVKLSARTTAWKVEDIRALIDQLATESAA